MLIIFVEQLRRQGLAVGDAILLAGRTRLRPILMTAFTTILALFPLAFSSASGLVGSELATVVIGGPDEFHVPHPGGGARNLTCSSAPVNT